MELGLTPWWTPWWTGTPNGGSTEVFLEPIAVDVIAYDVLTAVAAGHEVVDSVRILEA